MTRTCKRTRSLFDTVDTLLQLLPVVTGVELTLQVQPERGCRLRDDLLATDLADYLARKRLPFRERTTSWGAVCCWPSNAGGSDGLWPTMPACRRCSSPT